MEQVTTWFASYWWAVLLALGVAIKVLNTITVHWSEKKGLVKVCLFLIDLLDVLKSTPPPKKPVDR